MKTVDRKSFNVTHATCNVLCVFVLLNECFFYYLFDSPREEQLFTLGWKDNCYFYGDAETYMTRPSGTLERRRLYTTMTLSRGTMEVDGAHATADKEDESEDLDDIIRRESGRSDEDMFLPQPIPSLIQSLPSLLQKISKNCLLPTKIGPAINFLKGRNCSHSIIIENGSPASSLRPCKSKFLVAGLAYFRWKNHSCWRT